MHSPKGAPMTFDAASAAFFAIGVRTLTAPGCDISFRHRLSQVSHAGLRLVIRSPPDRRNHHRGIIE